MRARALSPENQPVTRTVRRPMSPRRSQPPAACHWGTGWWATVTVDRFVREVCPLDHGTALTWPAQPGVQAGDVFLLVTSAPERHLRAWAWAVESPTAELDGSWSVRLRFGGHLGESVPLRQLRQAPGLDQWPALQRVSPGRLEPVPAALWACLTPFVRPPEPLVTAAKPQAPIARPWDGLGRGPFFEALLKAVLCPQGFALIELLAGRDDCGIDLIAQRVPHTWQRWTRLVAQLDVTGEAVGEKAVAEVLQGRQQHGAQQGLLIVTGPVTPSARAYATAAAIEIWDGPELARLWQMPMSSHLQPDGAETAVTITPGM